MSELVLRQPESNMHGAMRPYTIAGAPIELDVDIECRTLIAVVGPYGWIRFAGQKVTILPNDAEAGRWILTTLKTLGYIHLNQEGNQE